MPGRGIKSNHHYTWNLSGRLCALRNASWLWRAETLRAAAPGVQQNLGAALRAAYFLGAAGVLCCDRHSAPLSPAVSKVRSWRTASPLMML